MLLFHKRFLLIFFIFLAQNILAQAKEEESQAYPFEKEINTFMKLDSTAMPPTDAILFVGSSSIRMWKSLEQNMAPLRVINRGFGGSQTEHAIHYFNDIVKPYDPYAIVLYEGDNDVASGKTPQEIFEDFKSFSALVNDSLAGVPLFFIAIKPSIAREKMLEQMQQANKLIDEYCKTKDNLIFIDVASEMMDQDVIRPDIFIEDNLHMNDKGYDIWEEVVKTQLIKHLFLLPIRKIEWYNKAE